MMIQVLPGWPEKELSQQTSALSPEVGAGMLSTLTFAWLTPLLKSGYRGALRKEQIPDLPPGDQVDQVSRDFDK